MALFCCSCLLCAAVSAENVVFLDGTGNTEGAYTTLKDAAAALPDGGTIVVTGETSITSGLNLPAAAGKITLTSLWEDVNYAETNGAKLCLSYRTSATSTQASQVLGMGTETEWHDITLCNASDVPQMIAARGYALTIGENVVCTTTSTSNERAYPSLIGCYLYAAANAKSVHLTVRSGTWHSIFGGNWQGTFTGDSHVTFEGGEVLHTIAGGGYRGGFHGNAYLNIGGSARVSYDSAAPGVVGGLVGISGGAAYPFNGNIYISIYGNAEIYSNILGASRYANITTNGDITIDVSENAHLYRHVYGGGYTGGVTTGDGGISVTIRDNAVFTAPAGASTYVCAGAQSGTVTGSVKVVIRDNAYIPGSVYAGGFGGDVVGHSAADMYGGEVKVTLSAGARSGTIDGTAKTSCYGGKVGYYNLTTVYGINGNGQNETSGTVTGAATILLDGGDVAGAVALNAARVGEGSSITLKSGNAGSVKEKTAIDLSAGGSLTLGGNICASSVSGGGSLTLRAASSLAADSFSGTVALTVFGKPENGKVILTVNDPESTGSINYTSTGGETLVRTVTNDSVIYRVNYTGYHDSTRIHIDYYNPLGADQVQPKIVIYRYGETNTKITDGITYGTDGGKNYAEVSLTPGLYYFKVYYGNGGSDYETKYFYVSGKEESHTYALALEPFIADSYMENVSSNMTDEVMESFYGTDELVGYTPFTTPTFTLHADSRTFMRNAELCAFADEMDAACEWLYVFYPFADTEYGNQTPVLVFTKDEIPAGATFEEVGAIVRGKGVRDILMVSGGVHGNEPAGEEGVLNFGVALSGAYGEEILDKIGAVILVPAGTPDNLQRFKRTYADNVNPNRDLISLFHPSAANLVYVYRQFMPTVYVDCHEDSGVLTVDPADNSISDIDDVCFSFAGTVNTPLADTEGIADGSVNVINSKGNQMIYSLMETTAKSGLRPSVYYAPAANPSTAQCYAATRGSYSFLIEVMGIWNGKGHYARRVFAHVTGLKAVVSKVLAADGQLARDVAAAREATGVVTYDENRIFALKTTMTGKATYTVPCPSVYVDGAYKDENATATFRQFDTVTASRSLPTGYILPADTPHINEILAHTDAHGLEYLKIPAGMSLNLKKYTLGSTISLSDTAVAVTFENGAYAFLTDTSDVYLVAAIFEPDASTADESQNTLFQRGLLTESNSFYRSETDNLRAVIEAYKFTQIITVTNENPTITIGGELDLAALCSSNAIGAALTYTVEGAIPIGVALTADGKVTATSDAVAGSTLTVKVNSAAVGDYAAAAEKIITVTVTAKKTQIFESGFDTAVNKTYGDADFTKAAVLSSGDGAVSYKSSDESVAAVNASTGEVKILKNGTATITATAEETAGFAEASVRYILTVAQREAAIRWANTADRIYGDGKVVTAVIINKVDGDDVALNVAGGDKIDVGSPYMAAATLTGTDAEKYTLPDANTTTYSIGKAAQAAPTGLAGVKSTSVGGTSGKITGVTDKMEYASKTDFSDKKACTGTEITGLAANKYYVRYAETATHEASAYTEVTVPAKTSGEGSGTAVANYTLTFEVNGGSEVQKVTKSRGTTIDLAGYKPTKEGYEFAGWYSDKALTEEVTSVKLTKSTTVYAKWTKKVVAPIELPFTDVAEKDWFCANVAFVFEKGIMTGVSDTLFAPQADTTRGMIVTMLYRLEGQPKVTGDCPFDDVQTGAWYADAITWAAANKIVNGYGDSFGAEDPITREQMATVLYNYAAFKGYDGGDKADLTKFADNGEISDWAEAALSWANANALVNGRGGNTLEPKGNAARCEVAAILHRFCNTFIK